MPPEDSENNATKPGSELKQIRTFQGDVANALSDQKESVFSIQQSEVARRRTLGEEPPQEEAQKRKDYLFLLLGSIILIALGSLGGWYGYKDIVRRNTPPVVSIPENRFISVTTEKEIFLDGAGREEFASAFSEALAGNPESEIRHVVGKVGAGETERIVTTAELFDIIESRAAGSLIRSFENLTMIGALGESRFMVIKLTSYENAFAGMLSWEGMMAEDLVPVFGNAERLKAIAPESVFNDVIVRNKDVRVLSTDAINIQENATTTSNIPPETVLLYTFFDNNVLIITEDTATLQTLMERLTRERLSR